MIKNFVDASIELIDEYKSTLILLASKRKVDIQKIWVAVT